MGRRENKVEEYLDQQVKMVGGITRKWLSYTPGVPDRIVLIRGVVWFVEIKTVDGQRSDAQIKEQLRLKVEGANVETVYGVNGVNKFMKECSRMLPGAKKLSDCCQSSPIELDSLTSPICFNCYKKANK